MTWGRDDRRPRRRTTGLLAGLLGLLALLAALVPGPALAAGAATSAAITSSPSTAEYGASLSVKGTVTPATTDRPLTLQRQDGVTWVAAATGVAKAHAGSSSYSIAFQADHVGTIAYRVVAAETSDADEGVSSNFSLTTDKATRSLTATLSKKKVKLGKKVTLAGKFSQPGGETVELVRVLPGLQQHVASDQASAEGTYSFKVPTKWLSKHKLKVVVPESDVASQATKTVKLNVVPKYNPAGAKKWWKSPTFQGAPDGILSRWDACTTIDYRVNVKKAPAKGLAQVKKALKQIAQATGLKFHYLGTTTAIPVSQGNPSDSDLVIGWATDKQVPQLSGGVTGLGGFRPATYYGREASGNRVIQIDTMAVALDVTPKLAKGFGSGPKYGWQGTEGQLILHEVAHAFGLDHVGSTTQIMYYALTHKRARYGAGDLNGLHRVGLAYGCVTSEEPQRSAAQKSPQARVTAPTGWWLRS